MSGSFVVLYRTIFLLFLFIDLFVDKLALVCAVQGFQILFYMIEV